MNGTWHSADQLRRQLLGNFLYGFEQQNLSSFKFNCVQKDKAALTLRWPRDNIFCSTLEHSLTLRHKYPFHFVSCAGAHLIDKTYGDEGHLSVRNLGKHL